jgi:hypothetical protein
MLAPPDIPVQAVIPSSKQPLSNMPSVQGKGMGVGVKVAVGVGVFVGVLVYAGVGEEVTSATGQSPLVVVVAACPTRPFEQAVQYWPDPSRLAQIAYFVPSKLDI